MSEIVRFNYLHRDSGNYKKFGNKLFSNPDQLTIDEIEQKIRQNLIDHEYFYPEKVGIKKFKFLRYADDYSWYEFDSIEMLEKIDNPKKKMETINFFLSKLGEMRNFDIYLMGNQPTTCPKCGARTELKLDVPQSPNKTQFHKCLSESCKYFFAVEEDS